MNENRIQLVGAPGSPYTQKMLALMRFRRIPYAVTWSDIPSFCAALGVTPPKPALAPTFFFPDEEGLAAVCDSTPIIRRLEAMYAERSVIPEDPAVAFLDYLIEDFADEWCTKYMFHYRWHFAADADKAGTVLPLSMSSTLSAADLKTAKAMFAERQIGRLYVVGSNDTTAGVIDASYRRFLSAMEEHLAHQPYLLGRRPSACDFALHGQLSQLIGFDPTPRAIAHEVSPRAVAWVDCAYDLSGLQPADDHWVNLENQAESLQAILAEIGRVYVPAQLANAAAHAAGQREWACEIDGAAWTQRTFPYQSKCMQWTRERYASLCNKDRARVDGILAETGIEKMLAGA